MDFHIQKKILHIGVCVLVKNKITLSCICQDENEYLDEWIDYHAEIGFDEFVIYDNNSIQSVAEHTKSRKNVIVYQWAYHINGKQCMAQNHCLQQHSNSKWIAFLDVDEYIVLLRKEKNIKQYLKHYTNYSGLCLNWLMFGSNGHIHKQNKILSNYTQCNPKHPANKHVKSIVQPKMCKKNNFLRRDPHIIPTYTGCVDVSGHVVNNAFNDPPIIDKIMRINHYYTKSLEDFQNKMKRSGGNNIKKKYTMHDFNLVNAIDEQNFDILDKKN